MKLLILGGIIFYPCLSYTVLTIEPDKNDRAFSLTKIEIPAKKVSSECKSDSAKERHCRYQLNDYRTKKDSEIGCATNKNEIHSKYNNLSNDFIGDVCN
ncbi:hypothetical protein [Yersinia pekkanenii]|uniref:Uncharacterized protein n=1 Tax=Yersinia pekkanenii TaxID=1288385 RepID=A0A0T9P583_9GAMM|nr:hypothetical protein [Yersinia pekkanenii]CNH46115.1 Uncharacterised protein [Yersinia pekkanenii]CRY67624.1 Uncharacterised protein [Yersinia pekkanenii]